LTIRRAARSGHPIYLGNAAPKESVARRISWYLDELAEAGRSSDGVEVPVMREMYVAPSREEAIDGIRESLELAYHRDLIELGWGIPVIDADGTEGVTTDPNHPAASLEALIADRCVVGSPEDCIARIREYERSGVSEILFRVHHAHVTQEAVMNSLQLFADEVMPAFREDAK
jgi:alkanesulfonate monooxygenase SsuD/methylene tetrahydromethanopterin reductase-like flavin-dependent oxidoreductase (luciferase family)